MADRVCLVTGNLTTAATWGVNDATGSLISTNTGSTTLTTGNLDSATFTPGAITIAGFCLRLASRAAGSPANTLTAILRNSTDGINVATIVINVSDLPVASTGANNEGGWHFFRINGNLTLTAGKAYLIRLTLSATTTAVAICTNGTASNWQRILVTSTTGAPAAGDDMHICQEFVNSTSPATRADRTVTMDQTAATDYGSAQTSAYVAALDVSKGGTLTFDTSVNSLLRLSGHLKVYSSGSLTIGASGAEVPRTKTAILEFDCAADQDFYLWQLNGGQIRGAGLSRTSGKNISQTLLTADQAAAATSCTVADDTGWLTGDDVAIAATTRTATEAEVYTLSSDASASTLTHTGTAAVNAHLGSTSDKMQAEVLLLTRNVQIRSVSTTAMTALVITGAADVVLSWVLLRYVGGSGSTNAAGILSSATTGTITLSHVIVRDSDRSAYEFDGIQTSLALSLDNCHAYRFGVVSASGYGIHLNSTHTSSASGTVSLTNCTIVGDTTTSTTTGLRIDSTFGNGVWAATHLTISNIRVNSCGRGLGMDSLAQFGGASIGPFYIHSLAGVGIDWGNNATCQDVIFTGDIYIWRCSGAGMDVSAGSAAGAMWNVTFSGPVRLSGNGTNNILMQGGVNGVRFYDLGLYGDTSFSTGLGMKFVSGPNVGIEIDKLDSGTAGGHYTTHSTADIGYSGTATLLQMVIRRGTLASTEFSDILTFENMRRSSWIAIQRHDADGAHQTYTDTGRIDIETTTYDVSPAMKMQPKITTGFAYKLDSAAGRLGRGYLVPVASGGAVTVSVKVRKDGSYAGAAPRLIVKANAAVGINADTVLDTLSVGADTWETLTGTTASVTDAGVLEFVVDCDGAAGAVYVDSWSQTGGASVSTSMQYWRDGLPLDILPVGSPGLQARSYPLMG